MSKKTKRIIMIICSIVLIIAFLIEILVFYMQYKMSKIKQVEINESEIPVNEDLEEELVEYRNIALFGVDSRENGLERGNRSDCIIIASLNNTTKEIKLVSVYRDTYVDIDEYGLDKINHSYSYGSAQLAISTLNRNLDLNIKEFATVNFDVLAEVIDLLGGIEINIDKNEVQSINETIQSTSQILGTKTQLITSAGNKNLNGIQAVAYSRIRSTSGGDYKRTERMRDVLNAIINKAKTKSLSELNKLANKILPNVYTNIKTEEILELVPNIFDYKIVESIGFPYNIKEITLDRWYAVPVTLESNVIKLHQDLFQEENYKVSETVKEISNKISKRTGYTK